MLNYSIDLVSITYHRARPEDDTPTAQELASWDGHLAKAYGDRLGPFMEHFGIADTPSNRERLILLAELSLGNEFPTKLKNACVYFQRLQNVV